MSKDYKTSTLFVSNLPENINSNDLESIFENNGPIKRCFVVNEKGTNKGRGFGYVTFSMHDDAEKAVSEKKVYKGRSLQIKFAARKLKPEQSELKNTDTSGGNKKDILEKRNKKKYAKYSKHRLIIRNLAFKASTEDLKETFACFGNILDINVPTGKDGNNKGFCFVQYETVFSAAKAIKQLNGREIKGRKVAIDWSMPKQKFLEQQKQTEKVDNDILTESSESEQDTAKDTPEKNEQTKDEKQPVKRAKKRKLDEKKSVEDSDDDSAIISDSSSSNSECEEDDSDSDQSMEIGGSEEEEKKEDSDEDSSIENDVDDDDEDIHPKKKVKTIKSDKPSDVEEGRTVFIRNIPFDSEEDQVEDCFSQWGDITYVCMVVDRETMRPKGTAFLKFADVDSAKTCLEDCEKTPLVFDGRKLHVLPAVKTSEISKLTKKEKAEKKDNRNLWLVRVGSIRQGTEEAKALSAGDLAKRMKIENVKRQKLKNSNIFVSPTRLCVHNIPVTVNNKQLKEVFTKAIADKSAQITECRIMCDMNRVNSKGVPKSRGFGFINFTEHQHAFEALNHTNNNPDIFGDKKKLIVEFSLENRIALAAKEKRAERIMVKQAMLKGEGKRATYVKVQKQKKETDSQKEPLKPPQKGIKGLPSHSGPKIRHKKRKQPPTSTKLTKNQQITKINKEKKKKSKKPKKGMESSDNFDSLVAKYKNKLSTKINVSSQQKKSGKWFQ